MPVIKIGSEGEYDLLLAKSKQQLVIVDFTAKWCGPCQKIAPIYEALSQKYRGALFGKVDVDECSEIAGANQVRAMPTFLFIRNGKEAGRIQGADPNALEAKIVELGGAGAMESFHGEGQRLGGQSSSNLSSASSTNSSIDPATSKKLEQDAQNNLSVDDSKPITRISIRLADGTKLTVRLNTSERISKLREFISTARPDQCSKVYSLMTTFPTKEIEDENVSIQEGNLENALIQQKIN